MILTEATTGSDLDAKAGAKTFILGNCLRGCFEGEFSSLDHAWGVLSARFLKSYPAPEGRSVMMWVKEPNQYGLPDTVLCRKGVTSVARVSDDAVMACRESFHRG